MELSTQSYDGITKDFIVKLVLGYIYYGHFAAGNMPAKRKNANMHLKQSPTDLQNRNMWLINVYRMAEERIFYCMLSFQ